MKSTLLSLLAFLLFLPSIRAEELKNDWLLIPEKRIGPITTRWTLDDLLQAFGALHCRKVLFPGEWEGDPPRPGILLYPGTADELHVFMGADGTVESAELSTRTLLFHPDTGEFTESKRAAGRTRWRSISGITAGSSVQLVEKVNGKPFYIEGWETEGGGMAEWKKGKIPSSFNVTFSYDSIDAYRKFYEKTMGAPGGANGASSSAAMRELAPKVSRIKVKL